MDINKFLYIKERMQFNINDLKCDIHIFIYKIGCGCKSHISFFPNIVQRKKIASYLKKKPNHDFIFSFRFSGITAADMKGVSTDIRGVQAVMLSMISDKTILMGHSLESDLVALKVREAT